jgi:uncharacterized protein DUF4031
MTVYVDPLFQWPTGPRCFRGGCCHMTADTVDELVRFAWRIGLREKWLQDGERAARFHFDVTPERRAHAVRLGAVEVSSRELVAVMKRRGEDAAAQPTHVLERSSPLGEPFVGWCVLCGARDLPMGAALERCENPIRVSTDEALLAVIEGPSKA